MMSWNLIRDRLIKDDGKRWVTWQTIALVSLIAASQLVLISKAPFHAFAIFYAVILILFRSLSKGKNAFKLGLFFYLPTFCYLASKQTEEDFYWNLAWSLSIFFSLFIFHLVKGYSEHIFSKAEEDEKVLKRDLDLWKSRFETLSEKKVSDKVLFEEEIEKIKSQILEKDSKGGNLNFDIYDIV